MQQFFEFVINHWWLWGVFFILFLTVIYLELQGAVSGITLVSPMVATQMMNHQQAQVLDFREAPAFQEGHILSAVRIHHEGIADQLSALKLDKKRPILISVEDGESTAALVQALKTQGFDAIFGLKGGLAAWREASLPLTR